MPRFPRPRAALSSLRARVVAATLLLTASACSGDRAPDSTADTSAARGATTTATADGSTFGGDTALARTPTAAARPVPGAPATATGVAPGTATSPGTGTATGGATATPSASGAPAGDATTAASADAGTASAGTAPSASLAPATSAPAQPSAPATAAAASHGRALVPFSTNERMEYDVKFGAIDVGDAAMQLNGIETVRGNEVYHTVFRVSGGTLFFKVNDRYESWIDTRTLVSHRFVQQIDEGSYERERTFEIYPDRGIYRENEKPEQKTVAEPLDDGSFFYFVRTIPLDVGKTYTFDRYFKPASNPVTIKVLRKERVKVPAGTFDAVVIQPLIKTKGIFGEGGRAEIWLADDSTRAMLQMKSQLKFGSLNLYLKKYRPGARPVPLP